MSQKNRNSEPGADRAPSAKTDSKPKWEMLKEAWFESLLLLMMIGGFLVVGQAIELIHEPKLKLWFKLGHRVIGIVGFWAFVTRVVKDRFEEVTSLGIEIVAILTKAQIEFKEARRPKEARAPRVRGKRVKKHLKSGTQFRK